MAYVGEISFARNKRYELWAMENPPWGFSPGPEWNHEQNLGPADPNHLCDRLLMFSQPGELQAVDGRRDHIGDIYFYIGYKYSVFVSLNPERDKLTFSSWTICKEFKNEYGTLLVFRKKIKE